MDIGVCRDGLVHVSNMKPINMGGKSKLDVGDKIQCILLQMDRSRGRMNLKLEKML